MSDTIKRIRDYGERLNYETIHLDEELTRKKAQRTIDSIWHITKSAIKDLEDEAHSQTRYIEGVFLGEKK